MTLRNTLRNTLVIAAIGAVGFAGAAPAASAATPVASTPAHSVQNKDDDDLPDKTFETKSGSRTLLNVDADIEKVLADNDIEVKTVGDASISKGRFVFPIENGSEFNPRTTEADIDHRGGLVFSRDGKELKVENFRIVFDKNEDEGILKADTGNTTIDLLKLKAGKATVTIKGKDVVFRSVRVELTKGAADALNKTLDVDVFKENLDLGPVSVRAKV